MNNDLRNALSKFSIKAVEMINCIKEEKFDELDELLSQRDKYIEGMKAMKYTQEEFNQLCVELDVLAKEKLLAELINEKRKETRVSIDKLKANKDANRNYNKNFYVDSLFFNKKI